jgi:hypothetical protein
MIYVTPPHCFEALNQRKELLPLVREHQMSVQINSLHFSPSNIEIEFEYLVLYNMQTNFEHFFSLNVQIDFDQLFSNY